MDPHRGFHHRLLKRQGLGGVIGGLIPGTSTSSTANPAATTASQSTNGDGGMFTSIIGDFTSIFALPSGSSSPTSSIPLTLSSSSSASSTTTSSSSTRSSSPTPSTTSGSTSSTSASTTSTPAPTPTSTSATNTVYTSSNSGGVIYITTQLPATAPTASPHASFLHDPALEGGVFALVGIVAFLILFITITCTIRKRRRARLERDLAAAVSFDPGAADQYEREENSIEKHRLSASTSGHGHGRDYGYGMQPAYLPQPEYHGSMGYGPYPIAAYRAPALNPVPYQVPTVPQPTAQGGANLTRKFSDRKPVPPLLPDRVYDPSNSHVSIPPQLYHQ